MNEAIDDCISNWARNEDARVHDLKTWPGPFCDVLSGHKQYEIRKNDRGFKVGDELILREWMPDLIASSASGESIGEYSGRSIQAIVLHITYGGRFGMPEDMCVLGLCGVKECL